MTPVTDFYPVPTPPPDEGAQHICALPYAWIPIIIGQLDKLRNPRQWVDPPADIDAQVDHLIYLIENEYVMPQIFPVQYVHFHLNSLVIAGTAIDALANASQEFGWLWRQSPAALDDEWEFFIPLDVGTYEMEICHTKQAGAGILNFQGQDIGGVNNIDMYNAATQFNQKTTISFTVQEKGLKRFHGKVFSKNPSSSGYVCNITYFSLKPT